MPPATVAPGSGLPPATFTVGGLAVPAVALVDSSGQDVSGDTTGVSQSADSATGSGVTIDLGGVRTTPVAAVTVTGTLTAGVVVFEGSLDGTSFYPIATLTFTAAAAGTYAFTPSSPAAAPTGVTMTGPAVGQVLPARYLRARVSTTIVGGTITATLGGAG